MILDEIVENKKKEVKRLIADHFSASPEMNVDALNAPKPLDLTLAIKGKAVGLIAEVKKKSPSAGELVGDFDPASIALQYEKAGACAISVLTDAKYFGGSIDDLRKVKKAVSVPVLRKDFIIDQFQLFESRLAGADAVLLIVRILDLSELKNLINIAKMLGLTPLVEVHSADEAKMAVDAGADVIGINNRDLDTLAVDINTTLDIISKVPDLKKKMLISESGIKTAEEVKRLADAGVKAVLVGESLLKSADIKEKIKELTGQAG